MGINQERHRFHERLEMRPDNGHSRYSCFAHCSRNGRCEKRLSTNQMPIFRIILVLLLAVNVLFAQAQNPVRWEFPHNRMNGYAISCLMVNGSVIPVTGTFSASLSISPFQEYYRQLHTSSALNRPNDFWIRTVVQRSVAGRFIVGVMSDVMSVAVPVQRFVNAYSSYDSGANQYSRPAVHIRPIISQWYAGLFVQLRF